MNFFYNKICVDINGVSNDDHIFNKIVESQNFYEIDLLQYMFSCLSHQKRLDSMAIDVGANIGNHSIFMSLFLSKYLLAIEPNPIVLPTLHRNLNKNCSEYWIYECAVGETTGYGDIDIPVGAENNIGMAKIRITHKSEAIEVKTIDNIVEQWQTENGELLDLSLIKIDVEGMELSVLKGATKTITQFKPHIFAEAQTKSELDSLITYLGRFGYIKLSQWADTPVYHFAYNPSLLMTLRARIKKTVWSASHFLKRTIKVFYK